MKDNKLTNIVVIILAFFLGACGMYMLIHFLPVTDKNDVISRVEKNVTVTEEGISSGIEAVYDSVVVIENYQREKLAGIGSGFIYDKKGYILTNHHVIENANEIKVVLMNGETLAGKVIGSDEYADIAVIQIDKEKIPAIAKIGDNSKMKVGDTVFTIGSPVSNEYAGTVTRGILSGKNRMVEVAIKSSSNDWIMNVMQTDAAINPGNSGGPLCNVSGEVIGINSMKLVQSQIEGIGFAIPIEDALDYAKKIIKGEDIKRSYLGIEMTDLSASAYYLLKMGISLDPSITSGAIVVSTTKDGPSDKAGLEKGDVIIKLGDYDIKNVAELRYYLYKYKPNDKIDIKVIRGTKEKSMKITLGTSD